MSGKILVERRDAIAILTLSNPAKRNALDPPLLDALVRALDETASEGARAAVLTGEGDFAFSSGYDLTALPDDGASENPLEPALEAIAAGPLPVVAALNGVAVG